MSATAVAMASPELVATSCVIVESATSEGIKDVVSHAWKLNMATAMTTGVSRLIFTYYSWFEFQQRRPYSLDDYGHTLVNSSNPEKRSQCDAAHNCR
jgi:hypothetical protein